MKKQTSSQRTAVFLTMIAAGIFLLGAAAIPLLARGQAAALGSSEYTLLPSTSNYAAPKLSLTDLQGDPVSLKDYLGKVILVNNWATWCPPCKAEMPEIQAYYEAHASENFIVVAIESGEPADMVAEFVNEYGLTFAVWLDPQGFALEAFQNWDLPSTYIIDQAGIVRMSWTGQLNLDTLEKYVTPLLEQ
jgi:cytochrome c biogenesis protein CcmG, thiol:disulfide interchange protein DsbE